MSVCCECYVLSGRGLCDALITRPEESYWLWCVVVCDLETSRIRKTWPALGHSATGEKRWLNWKLIRTNRREICRLAVLLCAIYPIVHQYDLDCHYALCIRFDESLRKIREDVKKKVKKIVERRAKYLVYVLCIKFKQTYRGTDKPLVRPGRKQARKHVRDARDFNNIETRAVIKSPPQARRRREFKAIWQKY